MTNTNREEWEEVVKELRHLAALLYNGGTPAPQQSGLDVDAAATLIETQGREIERYREALAYVTGEYHVARKHPGTVETCPDKRCEATVAVLQSPTQAPQEDSVL